MVLEHVYNDYFSFPDKGIHCVYWHNEAMSRSIAYTIINEAKKKEATIWLYKHWARLEKLKQL